jgi:outer membrane protein TolC
VRAAVVTLTASMVCALAGCATPTLEPAVAVPAQFAASAVVGAEPEAAWWENFGDPVLSDLMVRARP